jgi:hypothetical protein
MSAAAYSDGDLESVKFADRRQSYREALDTIFSMDFSKEDYLHNFPSFVGHMTIARFIALYEAYKMTLGCAGHIAEVGVYKAACSLWFAKLVRIFEPEALTMVHGFDWFKGTQVTEEDPLLAEGSYAEDYEKIALLIRTQGLDSILKLHKLDVTTELPDFFSKYPHLQFKLILLDVGVYPVVQSCIKEFYPRLVSGGIMLFDQFNHELAPRETRAIRELLPDAKLRTFPFCWMPTAYLVKP